MYSYLFHPFICYTNKSIVTGNANGRDESKYR